MDMQYHWICLDVDIMDDSKLFIANNANVVATSQEGLETDGIPITKFGKKSVW